jgi:hypothetical protein
MVIRRFRNSICQRPTAACGRTALRTPLLPHPAFVVRDDDPYAIVFADCQVHDGDHEAWIDIVLGTSSSDHMTFGAMTGLVAGQDESAAAVPVATTCEDIKLDTIDSDPNRLLIATPSGPIATILASAAGHMALRTSSTMDTQYSQMLFSPHG